MKTVQILSFSVVLTVAAAQTFQSLPDCGKLCVNNMLAKARELGCAEGDAACLCRNIDFAYGIRDCSTDVCGPQQVAPVIAYGESYCKTASSGGSSSGGSNSSSIAGPIVPPTSSSTISEVTLTSKTGSGSAIATSALVSLITSGTDVYTSTFSLTTIFSSGATPTPSHSQSSDEASKTSSIESSPTGSESSSSTGSGAKPTAIAGLAAVAGLAAMIL